MKLQQPKLQFGQRDTHTLPGMPVGQWPEILATSELLERVRAIHQQPADWDEGDLAERLWRFDRYRLEVMDIAQLDADEWSICQMVVDDYARMKTVAPPIVVDGATHSIIDGTHRLNAAIARGETTIWAYVGQDL